MQGERKEQASPCAMHASNETRRTIGAVTRKSSPEWLDSNHLNVLPLCYGQNGEKHVSKTLVCAARPDVAHALCECLL